MLKLISTTVDKLRHAAFRALIPRDIISGSFNHWGGTSTVANIDVTPQTAISVSAIFAALKAISEDVAKMSINIKRKEGNTYVDLPDHPVHDILNYQPNPETTAFDLVSCLVACALLFGNAYAEIVTTGAGYPDQLWPIEPWRVQLVRDKDKKLQYVVDGSIILRPDQVFHLRGFSFNGVVGLLTLKLMSETIALSKCCEEFISTFFANGAHTSTTLIGPPGQGPEALNAMRNAYISQHAGHQKAHGIAVVPDGVKVEKEKIDIESTNLLELRVATVLDVARWFRVPPHMLAELTKTSFNSIEAQGIDYVRSCLMSWVKRFQSEIDIKLLPEANVVARFNTDELTKGDAKSRADTWAVRIQNGSASVNEWRSAEGLNPLPPEIGDVYFMPMNVTTIQKLVANPPDPKELPASTDPVADPEPADPADPPMEDPAPDPVPDPEERHSQQMELEANSFRIKATYTPLIAQSFARVLHTESDKMVRAAGKPNFSEVVDRFYGEHRSHVVSALRQSLICAAEAIRTSRGVAVSDELSGEFTKTIDLIVDRHVEMSKSDLKDLDGLAERVGGWEAHRPELQAQDALESLTTLFA